MTAWTDFLKNWAATHNTSYGCAMTMPECKQDWVALKMSQGLPNPRQVGKRKQAKLSKASAELSAIDSRLQHQLSTIRSAPIPFNSRPVATSAVEYPSVFPTAASAQGASILPIHYFPLELAYPDADVVVKRVHIPKRVYAEIASIPVNPAYPLGPVPTFNLSTQTRAIMETATPVRGDAVDTQVDKETRDFWASLGVDMSDLDEEEKPKKKASKKKLDESDKLEAKAQKAQKEASKKKIEQMKKAENYLIRTIEEDTDSFFDFYDQEYRPYPNIRGVDFDEFEERYGIEDIAEKFGVSPRELFNLYDDWSDASYPGYRVRKDGRTANGNGKSYYSYKEAKERGFAVKTIRKKKVSKLVEEEDDGVLLK